MNKQEEIRKGMFLWMGAYGIKDVDMVKAGIELFRFFNSQGVVIKVEGELPGIMTSKNTIKSAAWYKGDIIKAGYTLTEPLIGEE